MCGNRRNRALRYQAVNRMNSSLLTGVTPLIGNNREHAVNAWISAVSSAATVRAHNMEPQYSNQVPVYPDDYKAPYFSEEPPAYERVSGAMAPEVVTREISQSTYNTVADHKVSPRQIELPPKFQTTSPLISTLIEGLTAALSAYQSGVGRQRHVRRAQKALRNQLYEEEIGRRQAMYGRLRRGERCEIWREIKAIDFGH